ncbi:ATP-dependent helicase [uncultured Bacteroides sp.]|uniref:ATP-dependent helicase n=1 Tax=uncultured Bacteroides sp. TaxID=162156 RepID=UPI00266F4D03|nr:ATP-dependent helicase [uncultured Bacteroides sp.]
MDSLNEQQKYAATFNGKHLLVLAGAGTGKTRTIIARAKHLIQSGVNPKRILILSFTRKSAAEIVERISTELPSTKSEGLIGSTFHSWCMAIIQNNPDIFPQASYTLLDREDQESCFRLLCGRKWGHKNKNDEKVAPKSIVDIYSYMANAQCSLSDAIRMKMYNNAPATLNVDDDNEALKGVIVMYLDYKRSRKYIDYDDILLIVSKYLKRNEELRKHIAGLYDHILVDEMQDTNPLQYELLSSFYEDCHLFCVGDDAQSIYAFRGADFNTIHKFSEIVAGAEVCKLTINYRSTQEILDLANWVIGNSPLNYDKKLIANRGSGEKPQILHWRDEWEGAENIALNLLDEFKIHGKKWGDNLVLSRSSWGMRKVEGSLIKHKIPYRIFGGSSLMQSRHIRDVVAPMRIVSNYLDEIAWSRYLQLWEGIGPVASAKIIGKVINEKNLDDCLFSLMEMNLQKEIADTLVQISNLQFDPANAITEALSVMFGRLKQIYKDEWEWRKDDFPILSEVAKKTGSISEFVSEYILDPQLDLYAKEGGKVDDCVILSTIHSAKGLEADNVFIVNASSKSYPTPRAVLNGEDAIEEERRCLYVALTRAKNKLRIYRDMQSIHTANSDEQFYFLNEIPLELFDPKDISAHSYMRNSAILQSTITQEDIYSDFDLN